MLADATFDDLLKIAALFATLAAIFALAWRLDCRAQRREAMRQEHARREAERTKRINEKAAALREWFDAHDSADGRDRETARRTTNPGPGTRPRPDIAQALRAGSLIAPAEMGDETRHSAAGIGDTPHRHERSAK